MSFVDDQVRRIDAQLDRFQLSFQIAPPAFSSAPHTASDDSSAESEGANVDGKDLLRIVHLQSIIKSLSTASSSRPLLRSANLKWHLEQADLSLDTFPASQDGETKSAYQRELEWLLVGKATTQTYGLILNTLLEQIVPLSNDIWYWDEVLESHAYTSFYTLQTSPLRFWGWSKDIYQDARGRLEFITSSSSNENHAGKSISERWTRFYRLVKDSIRDRSISDLQSRVMSPLTLCRAEARKKQKQLKRLREMSASGLGVLMDEGLSFDSGDEDSVASAGGSDDHTKDEWKSIVDKSVTLMETVLRNVTILETRVSDFEEMVFSNVEDDSEQVATEDGLTSKPSVLVRRLQQILAVHMPNHVAASAKLAKQYGRPSRLVRYWIPATLLLLSSSTVLRIFTNRRAEIFTWIRDLGTTTVDFWYNWVIEPTKKIIGTIRHDKDSEIAIMSKESLEGDRASLERMVVDFAVDNPNTTNGVPFDEVEIAEVRAKVREGDLTPVLKAYEKDLRKPFMGTIRGNLIRALLIQVQKTKVDVEVAVSGIDDILKSQELVFGVVGLTPGIFVCYMLSSWVVSTFGGRKGRTQGQKTGRMVRVLRNIDRILTSSTPSNNGMLSYKEHGLLLCEVHVLRQNAQQVLPGEINREFLEEIDDLVDIRTGVERQLRVIERIRWAYSKWIH